MPLLKLTDAPAMLPPCIPGRLAASEIRSVHHHVVDTLFYE